MKTIKIKISGSVQGVSFRNFLKETAENLNLRGFVRNLEDGRVETVAEGRDENVNEFLSQCKLGPKHSDVKNIEIEEIKHQGFEGFKISML